MPVAAFWSEREAPQPAGELPWNLTLLVAWAAVEEIVFRGGLQQAMMQRRAFAATFLSISAANLITSLVFSAAHLWSHTVLQSMAVFPVSLMLGLAYEQSAGLRLPIALHMWFNLTLLAAHWVMLYSA
jgi:uncharacterized protein